MTRENSFHRAKSARKGKQLSHVRAANPLREDFLNCTANPNGRSNMRKKNQNNKEENPNDTHNSPFAFSYSLVSVVQTS
jgi:hypothetical protein